ncbi:MAG: DUF3047 domain-containing protein [Bdellovibrionales bacterium]|nr:DUF3047 domain-containing protein [Bdellovibrionales bacterium]
MNTKTKYCTNLVALIFGMICLCGHLHAKAHESLENFESDSVGKLPQGDWKAREGDPAAVFSVQQEGKNKFLSVKDKGQSVQYFVKKKWKLSKYPCIHWSWRVHDFPEGSDERVRSKNDSAAAIYVVFPKRWFIPDSVKYLWSMIVPVDTVIRNYDRFPMQVVRKGDKPKGQWVKEMRNVQEDYKALFNRSPGNPVAIGFLTDSNSVGGGASADYDDIYVSDCSEKAAEKATEKK